MSRASRLILLWSILAVIAFAVAAHLSVAAPTIQLTLSGIQRLHWASVTCADASAAAGFAISIDAAPVLTTTQGQSATYFWNTANLSGPHTAACTTSDGSTSKVVVFGLTPIPTFSPSPTPTILPTNTPIATPTPVPTPIVTGVTYYVDFAAGNDANNGTAIGTPWLTAGKVKSHGLSPGDAALFKAGTTTNETLDVAGFQGLPGKPITLSSYGAGAQPIFDELNAHNYGLFACPACGGSTTPVKYLTIDNLHVIHASLSGVKFNVGGGNFYPGIIVQRSTIEDNGQGCATTTGACLGTDDGGYNNCLDFQDSNVQSDGVEFLNNTVRWCGGHNLVQVHYDTGAVVVQGNTVGPGGVHGYIDVKGVGSASTPAKITSNTLIGGAGSGFDSGSPLLYEEDNADVSYVTWSLNTGYDHKNTMFQFCPGACNVGKTCQMVGKFYNNTMYAATAFAATTTAIYANANCTASCNNPPCTGTYLTNSLDVRNSIFDGGDFEWGGGMGCTEHNNSIGGSQHSHGALNICGGTATGSGDQINVDPLYTNSAGADFTLQGGSPAINAGQTGVTANNNIGSK